MHSNDEQRCARAERCAPGKGKNGLPAGGLWHVCQCLNVVSPTSSRTHHLDDDEFNG